MQVKNNDKVNKWFFYKINGQTKKVNIPGMTSVSLPDLTSLTQVIRNAYDVKVAHINSLFNRHILGDFTITSASVVQAGPTSSNATVQAWINKITSDGYTYPSQAKVDIYTAAFNYADTSGITTELDLLGLLKVENQNLCKVPFIHSAGAAARFAFINGITFSANNGLKSDGTGYLDTNWIPSTQAIKYTQNNASFGANTNSAILIDGGGLMGTNGSNSSGVIYPNSGGAFFATINDGAGNYVTSTLISALGLWVIARTGTTESLYKNGSLTASTTGASSSISDTSFKVLTYDVGAFPYYTENIQFFYTGSANMDPVKMNTFVSMLLL